MNLIQFPKICEDGRHCDACRSISPAAIKMQTSLLLPKVCPHGKTGLRDKDIQIKKIRVKVNQGAIVVSRVSKTNQIKIFGCIPSSLTIVGRKFHTTNNIEFEIVSVHPSGLWTSYPPLPEDVKIENL